LRTSENIGSASTFIGAFKAENQRKFPMFTSNLPPFYFKRVSGDGALEVLLDLLCHSTYTWSTARQLLFTSSGLLSCSVYCLTVWLLSIRVNLKVATHENASG